jgi:hypothetical protein
VHSLSIQPVEIWRPVHGFEDFYAVSNLGRIKRIKAGNNTWVGRILKPRPDTKGYPHVSLCKFGKSYKRTIHRLVALAFLDNPLGLPEVNHKNGIKADFSVNNLEWCTRAENLQHAFDTGLLIRSADGGYNGCEYNGRAKLTRGIAADIRRRYIPGNGCLLAKEFGVCRSAITHIIKGRSWKSPDQPAEQAVA